MKLIGLMSGGIDSPVAVYLMLKKGADVTVLHMDNRPFTDDKEVNKAKELVKQLEKAAGRRIEMFMAGHGENQLSFARDAKRNLGCVLCRRAMLRTAEKLAEREGAQGIVTGESLGQVASQTLRNISVEEQAVSIPILRPLIGMDKVEIERIAKEIGTYEISISPGVCCTMVPDKPSTYANLERVLEEEAKLDMETLLKNTIISIEEVNAR